MKTKVYKTIPERAKKAIDKLRMSDIMTGHAYKLAGLLVSKGMQDNFDLAAYQLMHQKYFETVWYKDFKKKVLNTLLTNKIVECNFKQDQQNGIPYGYRLNQNFYEGRWVTVSYDDKQKVKKGKKIHLKERQFYYDRQLSNSTNPTTQYLISPDSLPTTPLSLLLHINTLFFRKEIVTDDLAKLRFNVKKMWKATKKIIDAVDVTSFETDRQIRHNNMWVVNHISGEARWMKRSEALSWASHNGYTLIRDGEHFYIDDLDAYVTKKKRHILLNYKWYMTKLEEGRYYANRNLTNYRLDHNLTSICSKVLDIVKGDNDLVEIDEKNAQFSMHAYELKGEGMLDTNDKKLYYAICVLGVLYEYMMEKYGLTRKEAKRMAMGVAFSKADSGTPGSELFRATFPNVVEAINDVKEDKELGHKAFSIGLQLLESEIFIDNLYLNIKEQGLFCITKHDSILVRRADVGKVMDIVRKCFEELRIEAVVNVDGKPVVIADKLLKSFGVNPDNFEYKEDKVLAIINKSLNGL